MNPDKKILPLPWSAQSEPAMLAMGNELTPEVTAFLDLMIEMLMDETFKEED